MCRICEANELLLQKGLIEELQPHADLHDLVLTELESASEISNNELTATQAALVLYALTALANSQEQWDSFKNNTANYLIFLTLVEALGGSEDQLSSYAQSVTSLISGS